MFILYANAVEDGKDITNPMIAMDAALFGCLAMTIAFGNGPNLAEGRRNATKVIHIKNQPWEGQPGSLILDGPEVLTPEQAAKDIVFDKVWFKYPSVKSRWALKNFSLTVRAGESVGIRGESGSGKSTLVQLLLRFYDPQAGSISIGGTDIRQFTLRSLRNCFGLVQQEPLLFNCSVLHNICYGRPQASLAEVVEAARAANAEEFIHGFALGDQLGADSGLDLDSEDNDRLYKDLDPGFRVMCGSRGSKLSGGQKQRIAIARAIIRNPQVLLLDEATSALDEHSQRVVQEALDSIMEHRTSIVVAHRLTTLAKCDRVITMYKGVIVNEKSYK